MNPLLRQSTEQFDLFTALTSNPLPVIAPDQMTRIELLAESLRHTAQLLQALVIELTRNPK